MKLFLLMLILSIPLSSWGQAAYISPTRVLRKGGNEGFFRLDAFQTSHVIDESRQRRQLGEGEFFHRYQFETGVLYGANDQLQFGIGARLRMHQARFPNSQGELIDAGSMGLQSTFATLHFAFKPIGRMQYTFESMFRYTPYTNPESNTANQSDLILGDDGNEYWAGLGLTYTSMRNDMLTFRGGFRNPGGSIANELYWQAEGALIWRNFALVAGVDGVLSLEDDPYEGNLQQRPSFNTGNSALYHQVSREWVTPYVGINLALGQHWRMELRGSQVITGRSTDLGTGFSIHLARRVEKFESRLVDARFKEYDIEANVSKISPQKGFVIIDRGLTSDVQTGMRFDFFEFDYVGGNVLVARGVVTQAKADSAIVRITHRYNAKIEVKEGMVARASLK
jgi:hypothetical protein